MLQGVMVGVYRLRAVKRVVDIPILGDICIVEKGELVIQDVAEVPVADRGRRYKNK